MTTESNTLVKVGIAADPLKRFSAIQSANFVLLRLHKFWWVAGQLISERIERDFKDHFKECNIRGEWFDLSLPRSRSLYRRFDLAPWHMGRKGR